MSFWEHAPEYLGLILSVVLSFFCGRLQANTSRKTDSDRLRYENFYIPYISHLYAGLMHLRTYSSLDLEARGVFFDLVMKNLQHLGPESQACVPAFYNAFLEFLDYTENPALYPNAPATLDKAFLSLTVKILKESKRLSARLRMPDIGKTISAEYLQRYT